MSNGKGDGNLHGRRQCQPEVMDIRWKLAFGKLDEVDRLRLEAKLKELTD